MRVVYGVLLACALTACDSGLPELAAEQGDVIRLAREFTLARDGETHLSIEQDWVVTVEDLHALDVRCAAVRIWIGGRRGNPAFDSASMTVADVLASPDTDMGAVYAATWADASLVRLGVRLDEAMNVVEVTDREGTRESGEQEEDAAHAVLATALSDPTGLVQLVVRAAPIDRATTWDIVAFGDRVTCTAAYRGIIASGPGVEEHAWVGDARVRGPGDVRHAARVNAARTKWEAGATAGRLYAAEWNVEGAAGEAPGWRVHCRVTSVK